MSALTPEKIAGYRRHAREREAERQLALERRKAQAWAAARLAATVLKAEYGATRVILFGSLAHGAWWHEDSDVDLAAEGIPSDRFWRAWGAVERLAPGIEINLAPLETVKSSIRRSIAAEGVDL